jgi:capsular exopolysaccharide synthesis family protein
VPVTGLPGGGLGEQPDVHVLDRLHVLYKYRKAMISVLLLVLVAGILQTYTTTPAFRATAKVRAEPETAQISAVQQAQQMLQTVEPEAFMQTELAMIQSRDLKLRVVRKLRLDQDKGFLTPAGPQGIEGMVGELKSRVMGPVRSLLGSWLSSPTPPPPPPAVATPATADVPATTRRETTEETSAVDTLAASLNISLDPAANIFTISYDSAKPERAAEIANAIADEYVAQNIERRIKAISDQLTTINEMLDTTRGESEADRNILVQRTTATNVVDPTVMAGNVQEAQREYTQRDYEAQARRVTAEEMSAFDIEKNIDAALSHPNLVSSVAPYRATIAQIENDIARLRNQLVGAGHPAMLDAQSRLTNARQALKVEVQRHIDAAKKAYQTADTQRRQAAASLSQWQSLSVQNSTNGIPWQALRDKIAANDQAYQTLLLQQNQLNLYAKGVTNNTSIAERAAVPQRPFKPNTSQNILLSLAVGVVLAIGLAFGLDYLDDTIKTPEDVTRKLHIPFLGLVPSVRGDRQPVLSGPVPHDFGEAYRALRTSLVFTSGGESTRIITVTSAQPLEGKTTTACNLAMVLSFGGSRVLLIDADMRRPGVHKTLKMNNTVGLSHLLVGQARVREAIQRTADSNFCVMTAGRTPPNPSELLSSERMKQLIANLKQGPFDWVVIDTPPVLAVTDAVILTPLVDGVTFVLGAEMTRRRLAERAVQMLLASRPRVIGGVLNRVNFDRNKYYYSRYYGYQYKSYYGADTNAGTTKA